MLKKEDLRYLDSNFYTIPDFSSKGTVHYMSQEDIYDPGRITLRYNLPFDYWPIIMLMNKVVDPITELLPGDPILIPDRANFRKIQADLK